jgi:hypothetical protein
MFERRQNTAEQKELSRCDERRWHRLRGRGAFFKPLDPNGVKISPFGMEATPLQWDQPPSCSSTNCLPRKEASSVGVGLFDVDYSLRNLSS